MAKNKTFKENLRYGQPQLPNNVDHSAVDTFTYLSISRGDYKNTELFEVTHVLGAPVRTFFDAH